MVQINILTNVRKFQHNKESPALTKMGFLFQNQFLMVNITITNTVFVLSTLELVKELLYIQLTQLYLKGPVIFYNISCGRETNH